MIVLWIHKKTEVIELIIETYLKELKLTFINFRTNPIWLPERRNEFSLNILNSIIMKK